MSEPKFWIKPELNSFASNKFSEGLFTTWKCELAYRLAEHFGCVAGQFTGEEDSSGRQKLSLQSPQELVDRCWAIADAFVTEAIKRGEIEAYVIEKDVVKT